MSFDMNEFREICQQASTTIKFDETAEKIKQAISSIDEAGEVAPFVRERLKLLATNALELLETRRTDANQLLGALSSYLSLDQLDEEGFTSFEDWFVKVSYNPLSVVGSEIIDKIKILHQRNPKFAVDGKISDIAKRLKRSEQMASTSINPEMTLSSLLGLERILRAVPFEEDKKKKYYDRINAAKVIATERKNKPLVELFDESFSKYEQILIDTGSKSLEQSISWELQTNIFGARRMLENAELDENFRQISLERLNNIEEQFDKVRFLSSTTIFKRIYEPYLNQLDNEVDKILSFSEFSDQLKKVQERSRAGRTRGVDYLENFHRDSIDEKVIEIREKLKARFHDKAALLREIRLIEEQINELNQRPILRRDSIIKVQNIIKACLYWAWKIAPDEEAKLTQFKAMCKNLWDSIDSRYQLYLENTSKHIEEFLQNINVIEDFRSAFEEGKELKHSILDKESGFKYSDQKRLLEKLDVAKKLFFDRLGDPAEIEQGFATVDSKLSQIAQKLRRYSNFDEIEAQAKMIDFRIRQASFRNREVRQKFILEIRRTYARIQGLKRKKEEELEKRLANQELLFKELEVLIREYYEIVKAKPADHASWELLIDADSQLREANILSPEQRRILRDLLEGAFAYIKEERSKFAQEASVIYGKYLDEIQNILQPLERTAPKASRADAFEAIEAVKPLRLRLRNEDKLLRIHRQELSSHLKVISDAISEILDKASEGMQKNLVHLRRRIEELGDQIQNVQQISQLQQIINTHKSIYTDLRDTELSLEGRKECRSFLEELWDLITEKKQEFGRGRFNVENIDSTLSKLEDSGYFLWMNAVPRI